MSRTVGADTGAAVGGHQRNDTVRVSPTPSRLETSVSLAVTRRVHCCSAARTTTRSRVLTRGRRPPPTDSHWFHCALVAAAADACGSLAETAAASGGRFRRQPALQRGFCWCCLKPPRLDPQCVRRLARQHRSSLADTSGAPTILHSRSLSSVAVTRRACALQSALAATTTSRQACRRLGRQQTNNRCEATLSQQLGGSDPTQRCGRDVPVIDPLRDSSTLATLLLDCCCGRCCIARFAWLIRRYSVFAALASTAAFVAAPFAAKRGSRRAADVCWGWRRSKSNMFPGTLSCGAEAPVSDRRLLFRPGFDTMLRKLLLSIAPTLSTTPFDVVTVAACA